MNKPSHLHMICAIFIVSCFSGPALSSSFNVDFGRESGVPSDTYGAASGVAGVWDIALHNTSKSLVDTRGENTLAVISVSATNDGAGFVATTIDDTYKLINDNFYTCSGSWVVTISSLSNGLYNLYVYAPSNTIVSTGVMTINSNSASELTGTNSDPRQLINGVSYSMHQVDVADGTLSLFGTTTGSSYSCAGLSGLQISPISTVEIDIKPGSDPNCFNINGHGVIPVAVLGAEDFDVTDIDLTSLSFGGLEVRMRGNKGPLCSVDYSNDDPYLDLICQFEDDSSMWVPGDGEATLTGDLFDGTSIEGSDSICIVP